LDIIEIMKEMGNRDISSTVSVENITYSENEGIGHEEYLMAGLCSLSYSPLAT